MDSVIEVRRLSRRFGTRYALRALDLDVRRGELFVIVGADGAGKTTLLQSLCAILDPSEGQVRITGLDSVRDAARITSMIGYMSQAYSLYGELTVAENLEFFASLRDLDQATFEKRRERLLAFSGLAPFTERRTSRLSGGMQKKLALCCSLLHEPDLLILDEPTLGVDPLSRRDLWSMLDEYRAQRKTVVMATSYMDEAARGDRVAILAGGRIIGYGPPTAFGADLEDAVKDLLGRGASEATSLPFSVRATAGEAIRVEGVTKRFGDFVAVDNVTLSVRPGEVFGLLGPNGSGKSTMIRMLCGIEPPSAGTAQIVGVDVARQPDAVRGLIGYMSQKFSLYLDLTVNENIQFFGGVYGLDKATLRTRTDWLVGMAGLGGHERTLAGELSGALRQRLALGCAVLHQPAVVFLDEPTSGVDPVSRASFWRLIRMIADSGTAVLVTTHYLREAEQCDLVAFIDKGKLLRLDRPGRLRAEFGVATLEQAFLRAMEPARP